MAVKVRLDIVREAPARHVGLRGSRPAVLSRSPLEHFLELGRLQQEPEGRRGRAAGTARIWNGRGGFAARLTGGRQEAEL